MACIIRVLAIATMSCVIASLATAQDGPKVPVVLPELIHFSRGPRGASKELNEALLQVYTIKLRPRLTVAGVAMSEQILRSTEKLFAPGNFGGGSQPFGGGNFGGPFGGGLFGGQSPPNESVKKR
jgi:hypothetical protein